MFCPYGSLLGDGSEDAALLRLLLLFLVPLSLAFVLWKAQSTQRNRLYLKLESRATACAQPQLPPEILTTTLGTALLNNNTLFTQIYRTSKGRQSRAMRARARLRQQHKLRSLFVARNK